MTAHIDIDELADAAAGLLDEGRAREVAVHVAGCPSCQASAAALRRVSELLAAEPAPPMPPQVAARLDTVLAEEGRRRAGLIAIQPAGAAAPHRRTASRPRLWLVAAAVLVVTTAGLGGFVLTGLAGLNEPTASAPIRITSSEFEVGTSTAENQPAVNDPHRFSRAWWCARRVTEGRITGLSTAVVDGEPALLVYTERDGTRQLIVVRGCNANPSAGPSMVLPR